MNIDKGKTGRGSRKATSKPTSEKIGQIAIRDMQMFLRYLAPHRLELLDILKQGIVPMSEKVLAGIMLQPVKKIHANVAELERDGIVESTSSRKLYVLWDSIQITVQQVLPYVQNAKVSNIVDAVLLKSARKYSWLHAKLESVPKQGRSRTVPFNCVLELLIDCE